MEDASGAELDWFWRGWFYSVDHVDIGIKEVKRLYITDNPTEEGRALLERFNITDPSAINALFVVEEGSSELKEEIKSANLTQDVPSLVEYLDENFDANARAAMKNPTYFYQITFEKPGAMPMPILVEYTFSDGSTQRVTYPVQVWRKNDREVSQVIAADKEISKIVIDPELETADVNVNNNVWTAGN